MEVAFAFLYIAWNRRSGSVPVWRTDLLMTMTDGMRNEDVVLVDTLASLGVAFV